MAKFVLFLRSVLILSFAAAALMLICGCPSVEASRATGSQAAEAQPSPEPPAAPETSLSGPVAGAAPSEEAERLRARDQLRMTLYLYAT